MLDTSPEEKVLLGGVLKALEVGPPLHLDAVDQCGKRRHVPVVSGLGVVAEGARYSACLLNTDPTQPGGPQTDWCSSRSRTRRRGPASGFL